MGAAEDLVGVGHLRADDVRHPEVHALGTPGGGDQDVRRLRVPVDDALGMGVLERPVALPGDAQDLFEGQRRLLRERGKRKPLDVLHHDEGNTVAAVADVEDRHDARVQELARRAPPIGHRAAISSAEQTPFVWPRAHSSEGARRSAARAGGGCSGRWKTAFPSPSRRRTMSPLEAPRIPASRVCGTSISDSSQDDRSGLEVEPLR